MTTSFGVCSKPRCAQATSRYVAWLQAEFGEELVAFDPHVVMVDLDLGPGPSGMQLLALVEADSPWVAKIVVTSHRSTRLVDGNAPAVPDVTYIVKADITSADQIVAAVNASL